MNTAGANPGDTVTFVALAPSARSDGKWTVVGADSEVLANPVPAVSSFTLWSPIVVGDGDTLAVLGSASVSCYWATGSTPSADSLFVLTELTTPTPGQVLSSAVSGSTGGYTLNLAATLVTSEEISVRTAAAPPRPAVGSLALLTSTVRNSGPSTGPVSVIDAVPAGMTVDAVAAGGGTCAIAGQLVTCTIANLPTGQSAPVDIVVTPKRTGNFTNTVSANPTLDQDPNSANNVASATMSVGQSSGTRCVVPALARIQLRLAKRLLGSLGCRVGKVTRVHSARVPKGTVVKTVPGSGTYAAGKPVAIQVSSGRKH